MRMRGPGTLKNRKLVVLDVNIAKIVSRTHSKYGLLLSSNTKSDKINPTLMKYDIFGTNVRNNSASFGKIKTETMIFLTWITVKILHKFPYKFRHEMFIKTSKYQTEFCILKPENEKWCLCWPFLCIKVRNARLGRYKWLFKSIFDHGSFCVALGPWDCTAGNMV